MPFIPHNKPYTPYVMPSRDMPSPGGKEPDFLAGILDKTRGQTRVREPVEKPINMRDNAMASLRDFANSKTMMVRKIRTTGRGKKTAADLQRLMIKRYLADLRASRQFVVDWPTLRQVLLNTLDAPGGAAVVWELFELPHEDCWFECHDPHSPVDHYSDTDDVEHLGSGCHVGRMPGMPGVVRITQYHTLQFTPRDDRYGRGVRVETLPAGLSLYVFMPGVSPEDRARYEGLLRDSFDRGDLDTRAWILKDFERATRALTSAWFEPGLEALSARCSVHPDTAFVIHRTAFTCMIRTLGARVVPDHVNKCMNTRSLGVANPLIWMALIAHVNATPLRPEQTRTEEAALVPTIAAQRPDFVGERTTIDIVIGETPDQWIRRARRAIVTIARRRRRHEVRGHWRTYRAAGRTVWVPPHERGDATLGYITHDYRVIGARPDEEHA